ncbi:MAG: hypothetical protein IJU81_09220 [Bacteroidales bacterium]|nr:hypothetical protein [Bacteroidales bacterium]
MSHPRTTLTLLAACAAMAVAIGCSSVKSGEKKSPFSEMFQATLQDLGVPTSEENKAERYEQVYSESPEVIYIAPVVDLSKLRANHDPADSAYNREVSVAAHYLYQTMAAPLNQNGYYAISNMTAREMARVEPNTTTNLKNSDLSGYATQYGADAVLFATIHRWHDQPGVWTVYVDFTLRSTHTGEMIAHTAVKASKQIPYTITGEPVKLVKDTRFCKKMSVDNGTAQRCMLLEEAAGFVLRDLPKCRTTRQYRRDLYNKAIDHYISFTINDEGKYEVLPISIEDFEPPASKQADKKQNMQE